MGAGKGMGREGKEEEGKREERREGEEKGPPPPFLEIPGSAPV